MKAVGHMPAQAIVLVEAGKRPGFDKIRRTVSSLKPEVHDNRAQPETRI